MDSTIVTQGADTLSPVALFIHADIVVKLVMLGLLAASVWTWTIIVSHSLRLGRIAKASEKFERDFWKADDVDRFYEANGKNDLPAARVLAAGVAEWRRSTAGETIDRDGTRARLATAMGAAVAGEVDKLADRLNILATVGSVAPFVGLFGTVWGIMRSFTAIAGANNTSLAVVAPGIAEALFATAIGLFAAIPAVIAYNRIGHRLNRLESRLSRFADGFHATLSRELEPEAMAMMTPGSGQRGGRRPPMAEINVTPLVDVMLVLLIIFMVTAPLLVAGVPVDLPDSRAGALDKEDKPVSVSLDGEGRTFVDDDQVSPDALPARLAQIAATPNAKPGGPRIFLRADRGLDYGRVMQVMGELDHAGLRRVALVTTTESKPRR